MLQQAYQYNASNLPETIYSQCISNFMNDSRSEVQVKCHCVQRNRTIKYQRADIYKLHMYYISNANQKQNLTPSTVWRMHQFLKFQIICFLIVSK